MRIYSKDDNGRRDKVKTEMYKKMLYPEISNDIPIRAHTCCARSNTMGIIVTQKSLFLILTVQLIFIVVSPLINYVL